jgi:hypothetical protein
MFDTIDGPVAQKIFSHQDGSSESYAYDRAGFETARTLKAADGSYATTRFGSGPDGGATQTESFGANGQKLVTDLGHGDGSHTVTALVDGLTLASHAGVKDIFVSAGSDTFAFKEGFGNDLIQNFHATSAGPAHHDVIEIDHGLAASFGDLHMMDGASGAVIQFGHDTITLAGIKAAQLSAADFHFV